MSSKKVPEWTEAKRKLVLKRRKLYEDLDQFGRVFEREDLETDVLYNQEFIDIHLITGEVLVCRLLEMGKYFYFVEIVHKKKKRILIPKTAIKFVLLRDEPKNSNGDQEKVNE